MRFITYEIGYNIIILASQNIIYMTKWANKTHLPHKWIFCLAKYTFYWVNYIISEKWFC